jgi:hypothetical protein
MIHPVIVGSGNGSSTSTRSGTLRLTDAPTTKTGVVVTTYVRDDA